MFGKKDNLPTHPSLVGKEVYLRTAAAADIGATHHWSLQAEPETLETTATPFLSGKDAEEEYKKRTISTDSAVLMIVRKSDKIPVGRISFSNLDMSNRSASIALVVDPDEREKAYGKEGLKLLAKYLFLHRGLNKVYGQTPEDNKPAAKLLESVRFKKDGALRDHCYYGGEFHNVAVYSLVRFDMDW